MNTLDVLISSNPALGAENITNNGSSISLHMDEKIGIPPEAKNVALSVIGAEVWYNIPNITSINNGFRFMINGLTYNMTIPTGLYSGATIPDMILSTITESGTPNLPTGDWFILEGNEALNKMTFKINADAVNKGFSMIWTQSSIADILGFTTNSTVNTSTDIAENIPKFNAVNYFLLQSDIVHNGISTNGQHNNIIAKILIDVSPNSQILYRPSTPNHIQSPELAGTSRRDFRFNLLDDQMNPLDTRGEFWSAHLRISWM